MNETIENNLLVVTKDKKLLRLHCPFPVQVIKSVDILHEGAIHLVVAVKMNEVNLLYIIEGKPYPYSCFLIIIKNNL